MNVYFERSTPFVDHEICNISNDFVFVDQTMLTSKILEEANGIDLWKQNINNKYPLSQ